MTLSDKTLQLLSSHKLLSPKSRSTATPQRKIVRAMNRAIKTLNTTNGFRATLLAAFIGFPLVAGFGDAHAADLCKLEWLATIDGKQALQPVELIIRDPSDNAIVFRTLQWSGVFDLRCAEYTATATLGDLTRGRNINLVTPTHTLIIDLGE